MDSSSAATLCECGHPKSEHDHFGCCHVGCPDGCNHTFTAAHTSLAEKQRTFLTAALLDLRDVVDSLIEGDASIKDVENALARTYEVPCV